MQCLPQLLSSLSLLMGQTPQAKVHTIFQVSELARKATVWANTPLKSHGHHSPVVVFIANAELLQKKGSNMSLISCQAAADGDDEAVYMRLCLKEILLGQLDLQHWQTEAQHISCCSGDGLSWCPRCLSSLFVLLPWLEGQDIWPGGARTQTTMIRWCHSAAHSGHVVTKRP